MMFQAYISPQYEQRWASAQENLSSGFVNNKGADQPAHLLSLISAFVIHYLKSIVVKLASRKISTFYLGSVAEETCLCLALSETPKTRFCHVEVMCQNLLFAVVLSRV